MQEITTFFKNYERATNSHEFSQVKPYIHSNATYWFTNGSFTWIFEIQEAFNATWNKIQNEIYSISDIRWLSVEDNSANCTYDFTWKGTVNGTKKSGKWRGTNIFIKEDSRWKIIHEHLSN